MLTQDEQRAAHKKACQTSRLTRVQQETLCSLANVERTLASCSGATIRKLYLGDWIDYRYDEPTTWASANRPRLKFWRLTQKGCDAVALIWKREHDRLASMGLRADQLREPPVCQKYDRDMG